MLLLLLLLVVVALLLQSVFVLTLFAIFCYPDARHCVVSLVVVVAQCFIHITAQRQNCIPFRLFRGFFPAARVVVC